MKTRLWSLSACLPARLALLVLLTGLLPGSLSAVIPTVTKLLPKRSSSIPGSSKLSLATSDSYIVLGDRTCSDDGPDPGSDPDIYSGAVSVFSATTGAFLRQIHAPQTITNDQFGASVAVDDNRLLATAPGLPRSFIYDLKNGKLLYTLNAGSAANYYFFGVHAILSREQAILTISDFEGPNTFRGYFNYPIPAPPRSTPIHWFFGSTGPGSLAFDYSGWGRSYIVGYPDVDSDKGQASLSIPEGFSSIGRLFTASDGVAGDKFGTSVAADGRHALVGAVGDESNRGSAYLFDIPSGLPLSFGGKLQPPGGVAGDLFGTSVALTDNLALVGAPEANEGGNNRGAAYLFNRTTGIFLRKLTAPDGADHDQFGYRVAFAGGNAVVLAIGDDDAGENAGSAYLFSPTPSSPSLITYVSAKSAGLMLNTTHVGVGEAALSDDNESLFSVSLGGSGASAGKNRAVYDTLGGFLRVTRQSGISLAPAIPPPPSAPAGAVKAGPFSHFVVNQPNFGLFQATLTGSGVNSSNNRALFSQATSTSAFAKLLRTGDVLPAVGTVASFSQVVQPMFTTRQAMICRLKPGTGTPPATPASDTFILALNNNGSIHSAFQEGATDAPGTDDDYGQFSRLSFQHVHMVSAVPLAGPAPETQGLFRFISTAPFLITHNNWQAPDASASPILNVKFRSFLGETTSFSEEAVFRATLQGEGITTANGEGLWWEHDSNGDSGSGYAPVLRLALRKGQQVAGQPTGVVFHQFINYWGMDVVGAQAPPASTRGQILLLATLKGPGINRSNDRALCLLDELNPPVMRILLREGDPAPGYTAARIGTISRVVASPYYAQYAVLATLTGISSSRNLALFRGATLSGTTPTAARRPFLVLRKGATYDFADKVVRLTSIDIPTPGIDVTGAGGTGLGQSINRHGTMLLRLTYSDGTVRLQQGIP